MHNACATAVAWVLVGLGLGLGSGPAVRAAQAPPQRRWVHDRGQNRQLEIALDELWVPGAAALTRLAPLSSPSSLAALRTRANQLAGQTGQAMDLVLYEADRPRSDATRLLLTRQVAFRAQPGTDAPGLAARAGARSCRPVPGLPGWYLAESAGAGVALDLAEQLQAATGVSQAEPQLARQRQKKFLPQDPYFFQQWHLNNTGQFYGTVGVDLKVTNVWDHFRGAGVVIGLLDDGLQYDHPDLAPNYAPAYSYNFNGGNADPYPTLSSDTHGTQVAGLAAARGDNLIGVCGVAFEAQLAALRLIALPETDADDAAAMLHSNAVIWVKNNSWGAYDYPSGNATLESPGPLLQAAWAESAAHGRGGKGTLFTFAAGNGGTNENINYDGFANSVYVVAVGALNDRGQPPYYSEPGACMTVVALSDDYDYVCAPGAHQSITTTDLMGGTYGDNYYGAYCELSDFSYTQNFSGTSAATPMVTGVMALLLQANPALGYRDVQEILLRSATKVIPADPDWQTNRAGIAHNHKVGAGLVNASAALALATNWLNLAPMTNLSLLQTNLTVSIPDNNPAGITRSFSVTNSGFRVEHVALTVTAPHSIHGQLAITLTSPAGTLSRLAEKHRSTGSGYNAWTFTSVRHWGEWAHGTWTVNIADLTSGTTGTLNALHLQLQGSLPQARLALTQTNSLLHLTLTEAAPGSVYLLEAADHLPTSPGDWTPAGQTTLGANGQGSWLLTNPAPGTLFYRARLSP